MWRRILPIAAVVIVLLAACTGGGSTPKSSRAVTSPPTSSTASGTPSPSPSRTGPLTTGPNVQPGEKPPVMPDAAKQHTAAGALLFAGYYFEALDWSIATNDPFLIEHMAAPSCQACNRAIDGLNSLKANGGHVARGRIQLRSAKVVTGNFRFRSEYVVEAVTDEDAVILVRPSTTASTSAPSLKNDPSLVFLSWVNDAWKIVEVAAPS